jgi:hypothetical protein
MYEVLEALLSMLMENKWIEECLFHALTTKWGQECELGSINEFSKDVCERVYLGGLNSQSFRNEMKRDGEDTLTNPSGG